MNQRGAITRPIAVIVATCAVGLGLAIARLSSTDVPATSSPGHITYSRPAFAPVLGTTKCVQGNHLLSTRRLLAIGVPGPFLTTRSAWYVRVRVCENPNAQALDLLDDGDGARVGDTLDQLDWTTGQPELELWVQHPTNGDGVSPCACGPGCTWTPPGGAAQFPAPVNLTFQPGTWVATVPATCLQKTCVELAGSSSMPTGCQ